MENYFRDLIRIPGLEAVLVFSNAKKILYQWTVPQFNLAILQELMESYVQIFGVGEKFGFSFPEMVIPYEKGIIYARVTEKWIVVVVAKLSVEVSLIRLIMDVRLPEILKDKQVQKQTKRTPVNRFEQINEFALDDTETALIQQLQGMEDGRKATH